MSYPDMVKPRPAWHLGLRNGVEQCTAQMDMSTGLAYNLAHTKPSVDLCCKQSVCANLQATTCQLPVAQQGCG